MVVKTKKVENPFSDFFRYLGLFFVDIFTKNVANRVFVLIVVLFAFLSILTLIYIVIDSIEDENSSDYEPRKRAKNSMIYISFGLTIILTIIPVGMIFANKNIPLVYITG